MHAHISGELPASADPAALATLIAALIHGLAARAAEGASEAELLAAAEIAFTGWPTARAS